jgi:hypothetical protein
LLVPANAPEAFFLTTKDFIMRHSTLFLLAIFLFTFPSFSAVCESTGDMVLNENLITIESNSISLPLNLTYRSGIRVNQHASWVGLGFDLSLPYIERIPVGSVDEKADTFTCNNNPGFYSDRYYRKLLSNTTNGYSPYPDTGWFTDQQDIYILNADFASGRILFAQPSGAEPMQAYLQNWRPFVVQYYIDATDNINKWMIVTETGTKYIFGQPVKAGITASDDSTGQTWFGTDSTWDSIQVVVTGTGYVKKQVISKDHCVNESYNRRWYLTEIRSTNYDTLTGKGDRITFSYTAPNNAYHVPIWDLNRHAAQNDKAATSIYQYVQGSHKYANFTFSFDNYNLYPIYPYEIVTPTKKIRFVMSDSPTYDKLTQGDKRIDRLEVYMRNDTSYTLASQFRFDYDPIGLAPLHPYSSGGKGLLRLNSIKCVSADTNVTAPVIFFGYGANPTFNPSACYYNHDFFGFYRGTALQRTGGAYTYPIGQSDTGTTTVPGAEAWSVSRVVYGTGRALDYKYEPNIVTKTSTNETCASPTAPLRFGIRVKQETVSGGLSGTNVLTNTYQYGTGYTSHDFALRYGLDSMYALLNRGNYRGLRNLMILNSANAGYEYCIKSTTGTGSVKTYFTNPSSALPVYLSNPVTNLSLTDVYLTDSMSVNSLAQYRGSPWKTELFKQGTSTNPTQSSVTKYAIQYNQQSYITPKVISLPLITCGVGGGSGETAAPQLADNQNQTEFIGFVRQTSTIDRKYGVPIVNEIIAYNETNGLPSKTRATNSDGKRKLTRLTYAIDETVSDTGGGGSSIAYAFPGMKAANILTPISETVEYGKDSGSTNTDVVPTEVFSAQAVTWSAHNGVWLSDSMFAWKATLNSAGFPITPFSPFPVGDPTTHDPSWVFTGGVTAYDTNSRPREAATPYGSYGARVYASTIYGHNGLLPVASVSNANYKEAGAFTCDYDDNVVLLADSANFLDFANGWGKGYAQLTNIQRHYGQKCMFIKDTTGIPKYGIMRSNRISADRDYIFSAWVKLDSGTTLTLAADYYHLKLGLPETWPMLSRDLENTNYINVGDHKTVLAANTSGWTFVTMPVNVRSKVRLAPGRTTYIRSFFYVQNGTAYIDDVRFYPQKSQVNTTYYDTLWQQPIVSVDGSNAPSLRVTYDSFGRQIRSQRYKPTDHNTLIETQRKTYGFMSGLIYPQKGERVQTLSPYLVYWNFSGTRPDTVSLSFAPNGVTFSPIIGAANIPNTNYYNWSVPASTNLNNCKLKVTGSNGAAITSAAFSTFYINTRPEKPSINDSLMSDDSCGNVYKFIVSNPPDPDGDTLNFVVYKSLGAETVEFFTGVLTPGSNYETGMFIYCNSSQCRYNIWVVTNDGQSFSKPSSVNGCALNIMCFLCFS